MSRRRDYQWFGPSGAGARIRNPGLGGYNGNALRASTNLSGGNEFHPRDIGTTPAGGMNPDISAAHYATQGLRDQEFNNSNSAMRYGNQAPVDTGLIGKIMGQTDVIDLGAMVYVRSTFSRFQDDMFRNFINNVLKPIRINHNTKMVMWQQITAKTVVSRKLGEFSRGVGTTVSYKNFEATTYSIGFMQAISLTASQGTANAPPLENIIADALARSYTDQLIITAIALIMSSHTIPFWLDNSKSKEERSDHRAQCFIASCNMFGKCRKNPFNELQPIIENLIMSIESYGVNVAVVDSSILQVVKARVGYDNFNETGRLQSDTQREPFSGLTNPNSSSSMTGGEAFNITQLYAICGRADPESNEAGQSLLLQKATIHLAAIPKSNPDWYPIKGRFQSFIKRGIVESTQAEMVPGLEVYFDQHDRLLKVPRREAFNKCGYFEEGARDMQNNPFLVHKDDTKNFDSTIFGPMERDLRVDPALRNRIISNHYSKRGYNQKVQSDYTRIYTNMDFRPRDLPTASVVRIVKSYLSRLREDIRKRLEKAKALIEKHINSCNAYPSKVNVNFDKMHWMHKTFHNILKMASKNPKEFGELADAVYVLGDFFKDFNNYLDRPINEFYDIYCNDDDSRTVESAIFGLCFLSDHSIVEHVSTFGHSGDSSAIHARAKKSRSPNREQEPQSSSSSSDSGSESESESGSESEPESKPETSPKSKKDKTLREFTEEERYDKDEDEDKNEDEDKGEIKYGAGILLDENDKINSTKTDLDTENNETLTTNLQKEPLTIKEFGELMGKFPTEARTNESVVKFMREMNKKQFSEYINAFRSKASDEAADELVELMKGGATSSTFYVAAEEESQKVKKNYKGLNIPAWMKRLLGALEEYKQVLETTKLSFSKKQLVLENINFLLGDVVKHHSEYPDDPKEFVKTVLAIIDEPVGGALTTYLDTELKSINRRMEKADYRGNQNMMDPTNFPTSDPARDDPTGTRKTRQLGVARYRQLSTTMTHINATETIGGTIHKAEIMWRNPDLLSESDLVNHNEVDTNMKVQQKLKTRLAGHEGKLYYTEIVKAMLYNAAFSFFRRSDPAVIDDKRKKVILERVPIVVSRMEERLREISNMGTDKFVLGLAVVYLLAPFTYEMLLGCANAEIHTPVRLVRVTSVLISGTPLILMGDQGRSGRLMMSVPETDDSIDITNYTAHVQTRALLGTIVTNESPIIILPMVVVEEIEGNDCNEPHTGTNFQLMPVNPSTSQSQNKGYLVFMWPFAQSDIYDGPYHSLLNELVPYYKEAHRESMRHRNPFAPWFYEFKNVRDDAIRSTANNTTMYPSSSIRGQPGPPLMFTWMFSDNYETIYKTDNGGLATDECKDNELWYEFGSHAYSSITNKVIGGVSGGYNNNRTK